ncbi:hypothetical protein ABW20_dc0103773 [Dactylellina cionopaga]|nr:hypothetical protein ABW20_dc0103773 [Dactylellina cionopaga]
MSSKYIASFLALAGTAFSQTPPNFSPEAQTYFPVTYDTAETNPTFFANGGLYDKNAVQSTPSVFVPDTPAMTGQTFIILMVDPDAPSPQNNSLGQILHWLQPGVKVPINTQKVMAPDNATTYLKLDTTSTGAIAPYRGPAPPSIDPHRYIFMLFLQPSQNFQLPTGFEQYQGGNERRLFNADQFVQAAGLSGPIAGNFFLAGMSTEGNGSEKMAGFDGSPGSNGTMSSSAIGPDGTLMPTSNGTATGTSNGNGTAPAFPKPTQTKNDASSLRNSMSSLVAAAVFVYLFI